MKGLNDYDCIVCHTMGACNAHEICFSFKKSVQAGPEEHPGHRQGASRDVGDVRLAERRTEEGTTVRTLRLCALNGAPRPPTDRAPVRAHRALRAATKVSPLEIHFCGTQPCCFKRCS